MLLCCCCCWYFFSNPVPLLSLYFFSSFFSFFRESAKHNLGYYDYHVFLHSYLVSKLLLFLTFSMIWTSSLTTTKILSKWLFIYIYQLLLLYLFLSTKWGWFSVIVLAMIRNLLTLYECSLHWNLIRFKPKESSNALIPFRNCLVRDSFIPRHQRAQRLLCKYAK